jgi:hypothetical protein
MHLCRIYKCDKCEAGLPNGNSTIGADAFPEPDDTLTSADANTLRRHPLAWSISGALTLALAWAALAPLRFPTHDQLFEIPPGTSARLAAGATDDLVPREVRLTLGVQDVLLLRNSDTVPQLFGPVRILPGQDFRLPFEQASDVQVASTAHAGGHMTVSVVPLPDPGWDRLCWRLDALRHAIRYLKLERPVH